MLAKNEHWAEENLFSRNALEGRKSTNNQIVKEENKKRERED